jgi:four helix bundle protein
MLSSFQAYKLALSFHRSCRELQLPGYLKDQLLRASSSVALNLSEGSAKPTRRDQLKFYFIALGSLRESQCALELAPQRYSELLALADRLGGLVYRLCHPLGK